MVNSQERVDGEVFFIYNLLGFEFVKLEVLLRAGMTSCGFMTVLNSGFLGEFGFFISSVTSWRFEK